MGKERNILILVGPPGAGKTTQAEKIVEVLDTPRIEITAVIRNAIYKGTRVGGAIAGLLKRGMMVSDEMVLSLLNDRIVEPDCIKGFVLDGFPRTEYQQQQVTRILKRYYKEEVTAVIRLDVPESLLKDRVCGRWIHKTSGRSYHEKFNPPKSLAGRDPTVATMLDDVTGEPLMQKADDTPEGLSKRLEMYHDETVPILDFPAWKGVTHGINADQPHEKIWNDLVKILPEKSTNQVDPLESNPESWTPPPYEVTEGEVPEDLLSAIEEEGGSVAGVTGVYQAAQKGKEEGAQLVPEEDRANKKKIQAEAEKMIKEAEKEMGLDKEDDQVWMNQPKDERPVEEVEKPMIEGSDKPQQGEYPFLFDSGRVPKLTRNYGTHSDPWKYRGSSVGPLNAGLSAGHLPLSNVLSSHPYTTMGRKPMNFGLNALRGKQPSAMVRGPLNFSAAEPPGNHVEYFIPGLFAMTSLMLALKGLKMFQRFWKPRHGLREPTMDLS